MLEDDGQPVAGAEIRTAVRGQANRTATTDADGRFSIHGVIAATVNIFAQNGMRSASINANADDTNVVIHLPISGSRLARIEAPPGPGSP